MDNSKVIDIVLEYLRNKQNLTDLEKDILSSLNKLNEKPFDRSGTEQKLIENNIKYENMLIPMQLGDEAHLLPFAQLSDDEIWNNLYLQVLGLCLKELQIISYSPPPSGMRLTAFHIYTPFIYIFISA